MKMKEVKDANFDRELQGATKNTLVYFWAPWSKPCETTGETLESLRVTYDGVLDFFCMNVDENANIPASLGIKRIPHMALVSEGQLIESLEGRQPSVKIREFIEKAANYGKHP